MLETRVLRYFLAVAREGSITAAAQSLHVTQPTLSRQLMDLEDELGQKLFVRGAHHVVLTPEGILLRKRASEILDLVGKTESEFSSMGENISLLLLLYFLAHATALPQAPGRSRPGMTMYGM